MTHEGIIRVTQAFENYQLFETTPFLNLFSYLSSWNLYENLGIPYLPPLFPLSNLFFLVNFYLSPMPMGPISVANIILLNEIIGLAIGMCLVLRFVTKNIYVSLLVFVSCLFSNLLTTSMITSVVLPRLLFYFPYLLYFVLSWLRTGRPSSFLLAAIILGLNTAIYIPTIIVYSLVIFFLFYGFTKYGGKGFICRMLAIRPKAWVILIALCLFAFTLLPRVHLYFEVKDLIVPERGHALGPKLDFEKVKEFGNPLKGHPALVSDFMTFVIDRPFSQPSYVWNYAGPFVMYFALIGLFLGPFSNRKKIIFTLACTAICLEIISLGYRSPLFPVLNSIPVLSCLRHYMFFVSFGFFFIILLSAAGFSLWMKSIYRASYLSSLSDYLIILFSVTYGFLCFVNYDTKGIVAAGIVILIYCLARAFIYYSRFYIKKIAGISASIITIAVILQLVPYQTELLKSHAQPYPYMSQPVKIPTTRNYVVSPSLGAFTRLWSLVNQEAVVGTSVPYLAKFYPQRTHRLLNILYPGRDSLEVYRQDISKTVYTHKEPILGYNFPIYFFVPDFEIISKDCIKNDDCLNASLSKMAAHYRQKAPRKVYFFEGDILPPDLSKLQHPRQFTKITHVNIDLKKSTLHEIYGTVDAPDDGFIVRLENYHRYWHVTVDGKEEKIYRGNYAFQAFPVSKGHHNIRFRFESPYPVFFILHQLVFYTGLIMFLWVGYRYVSEREVRVS